MEETERVLSPFFLDHYKLPRFDDRAHLVAHHGGKLVESRPRAEIQIYSAYAHALLYLMKTALDFSYCLRFFDRLRFSESKYHIHPPKFSDASGCRPDKLNPNYSCSSTLFLSFNSFKNA